jgi:thiol-disulfide isomerase/thioredoxin
VTAGRVVLVTILAGTLSIGFAVFGQRWLGEGEGIDLKGVLQRPGADRLNSLPELRLPDLQGREIASDAWTGKVVVLNFWATWCPPCVREMPLFDELQQAHPDTLQVVGIAIDDPAAVVAFLAENPVGYPILLGDADAVEMSRRLGNRLQGLPFTVVFDRFGKRMHAQIGEVTRASLAREVEPLLPKRPSQTAGNVQATSG